MITLGLGSFPSRSDAFRRAACMRGAFWLDRAIGKQPSFMGYEPPSQLRVTADGRVELLDERGTTELRSQPLDAIEEFVAGGPALAAAGSPSVPHTIGFVSYGLAPFVEPRMRARTDGGPHCPLVHLARHDAVIAITASSEADDPSVDLTV